MKKTQNHAGNQKNGHISLGDKNPIICKFFKDFTNRRKNTVRQFLAVRFSLTLSNTETTFETLQQSGKRDSFKCILKSQASMYPSCLQFFRITTGTQWEKDIFDKSSLVMTYLTNLEVTEILCSFRSALERKTSKEIHESSRLEFLENNLLYQMLKATPLGC